MSSASVRLRTKNNATETDALLYLERCSHGGTSLRSFMYHFVIAMWRAKEAKSRRYENEQFLFDHCSRAHLFCGFTESAIGQSRAGRVLSQLHDSGRLRCA